MSAVGDQTISVGPTVELSLRVSVSTLSRVVFSHPRDWIPMLALEHKATLVSVGTDPNVDVKAQPFGGAIQILNIESLLSLVGSFNFDSERSRSERDFRIYMNPSNWGKVRDFCLKNMAEGGGRELELDPTRELVEEFDDTLGIQLKPEQYIVDPYNIVVENEPAPTSNVRASGAPTARIYRVYEVRILDRDLCRAMISNSEAHPGQVLRAEALDDAHKGGLGRANAVLVAAEEEIRAAFLNVPPERRGEVLPFAGTLLEGNVPAVLEGVKVTKYRHIRQ